MLARLITVFAFLGAVFSPGSLRAQSCGSSPVPISFDKKFSLAVHTVLTHSGSNDAELNVVDVGGIGYKGNDSTTNDQSMTQDEAEKYIVTQINDRQVAIVTACGYYACQISRGDNFNAAALAVIGEVCSRALGGDAGAGTPEFAIIPQFLAVSLEGAKKTRISIEVRNLTDGQLEFSDPRTSGPISVHRGFWESVENIVGKKVQVPGRQSRVFYVDVASPSGVDPEEASVSIALSNNAAQTASTKLLIANQKTDLNPPPVIGCGSINPQMTAVARPDVASMAPKTSQFSNFVPISVGANQIASNGTGFPYNGSGDVAQTFSTGCNILERTRTELRTSVRWANHTVARAGHSGGNGPGGGGFVQPIWQTTLDLPGEAGTKWTIVLAGSASLPPSDAKCSIVMDGVTHDIHPTGSFSDIAIDTSPGSHKLETRCSYTHDVGSFPPPFGAVRMFDESLDVTVTARRD